MKDKELPEGAIKNKIIAEANWRSTNGHGGVDDITRDNFILAATFGYFLRDEVAASPRWVKASERLPEVFSKGYYIRFVTEDSNNGCKAVGQFGYVNKVLTLIFHSGTSGQWTDMSQIEWLDESPVAASQEQREMMPVHPNSQKINGCPKEVPMRMLNEGRANDNHGQTLKRLKERGGLGVLEILDNIYNRKLSNRRETDNDVVELLKIMEASPNPNPNHMSTQSEQIRHTFIEYLKEGVRTANEEVERLKGLIELAFKECYNLGRVHPGNNMNKDWEKFKSANNL